jgi:UDP-N-acetylmuramate: L-alanyl-gamma-D-glutamyl-meso-diaminopimelate ligase
MMHYDPTIAIITGIAWDHINVFPTFKDYVEQFRLFIQTMTEGSTLYFYENDKNIEEIIREGKHLCTAKGYSQIPINMDKEIEVEGKKFTINLIGNHNLQNIKAAELVCNQLGVKSLEFYSALQSFTGAHKRLEILRKGKDDSGHIYLDFAHAPSKVKATTQAIKDWYPRTRLRAIFELHTYSSLNKDFIPQYKETLSGADEAVVFFSNHALTMKHMPPLEHAFIKEAFDHKHLTVISDRVALEKYIKELNTEDINLLLMTSGNFEKISIKALLKLED